MKRSKSPSATIISDDEPSDSSGIFGAGTDTGSDSAAADSGGRSSDNGSDGEQHGTSGRDGRTSDAARSGLFDLPVGDERSASARTASGRKSRARAGAGSSRDSSGSASAAAAAETAKGNAGPDVPRDVAFSSLGRAKGGTKSAKDSALAREFMSELFGLLFQGLAVVFRDSEWKLPQDDADELGDRLQRWLQSGGSKRIASFEKFIGNYQPLLMLIMALASVVGPRIAHTRSLRNAVSSPPQPNKGPAAAGNGGSPPSDASARASATPVAREVNGRVPVVSESALDIRPGKTVFAPLRRQDVADFPD